MSLSIEIDPLGVLCVGIALFITIPSAILISAAMINAKHRDVDRDDE